MESFKAFMLRILFFLMTALSVRAQEAVSIFGRVEDQQTGIPLIGVNIVLEGTDIGTATDLDGRYELPGIRPGSYNITASYLGYETQTRSNVIIQSRGNDDINFFMREMATSITAVEVVANPFNNSIESPLSVQRLSPEEIKTYPGGNNDIAKVVQSLPGVSGSIGGFRNDVIIRGGGPNENVYYLDGIEIPNINHFSTQGSAGGPVGLLNVDFIEGVDFTSSAFGAVYDNVLSGVLQFDQKPGNRRERQTNLRISGSEAALTTEGPLAKKGNQEANTSYIVSVRRSYLQFLFELLQLPIRPDYWDYQYKIDHRIDDRNSIFLTGIGSIDDFSVKAPEDFDFEQQAVLDQVPIIKQWTTTAGLGWKHLLEGGKGVMTANLSTNVLDNNFSAYEDNENLTGRYLQNVSRESEIKLRQNISLLSNGWALKAGYNITRASYTNRTTNLVFADEFTTDLSFYRFGLYGQASRSFLDDQIDLSMGLRADENTFTSEKSTLIKTLSPRVSVGFRPANLDDWKFSVSGGKYYKIAPYTVLGYRDMSGSLANADAPYTGCWHLTGGIEYRLGKYAKISVEGFSKFYSDYPVSVTDGISLANKGGDFSVLGNEDVVFTGRGRTRGIEFLFQQKLNRNFYGILAYTYFFSEFTNLAGDYQPSSWDNRHLASFTGGYKAGRNWEFNLRYRFAGMGPFAPVDVDATLPVYPAIILHYSALGRDRLPVYNQLDVRIDKKWNFKALTLNVYLELQNALAQNLPSPPQFGLDRGADGEVVTPKRLVEVPQSPSTAIPIIGLAFDF